MSKKNRGKGKSYFGSFDWTINNLLHLVDSLCERWDYKRHDDGTLTNKIVKTDTYISLKKRKRNRPHHLNRTACCSHSIAI